MIRKKTIHRTIKIKLKSTLQLKHPIVDSLLFYEISMTASFLDLTSLDHDYIICLTNSLESMSNDDDGSVFEEFIECDGDRLF